MLQWFPHRLYSTGGALRLALHRTSVHHIAASKYVSTAITPRGIPNLILRSNYTYELRSARAFCRASSTIAPAQSQRLGMVRRVQKFLQDNPFTKFSLILCAFIFGLSFAYEFYNKMKKKKLPEVVLLPPRVGHYTAKRATEVAAIEQNLRALRRRGSVILFITAPSGAGKTELACQYANHFVEKNSSWLRFRSLKPTILFLDGSTADLFGRTLKEAAFSLGLKNDDFTAPRESQEDPHAQLLAVSKALQTKLASNRIPWLVVVDNLRNETLPTFMATFVEGDVEWEWGSGAVVVTTQEGPPASDLRENVFSLDPRITPEAALQLLCKVARLGEPLRQHQDVTRLVQQLHFSPLAIALAASTVQLYGAFMGAEKTSPLLAYGEVLSSRISSDSTPEEVLSAVLSLYVESSLSDPRIRHTFDLIGSCNANYPIPASLIGRHLTHPFYRLPATPPSPQSPASSDQPDEESTSATSEYFSQLKSLFPFGRKAPTPPDLASLFGDTEDEVAFIRNSPLFAFKKYTKSGFELVYPHSVIYKELPSLFTAQTIAKLENFHLSEARDSFNRKAWFRQYRSFDPAQALDQYRRSLPGLSASGVLTREEFEKSPPDFPVTVGTRLSTSDPSYSEYQHVVSHYHRVIESLEAELKSAGGEVEDMQLRRYLKPHFKAASEFRLISDVDRATCSYGVVSVEAVLSAEDKEALGKFEAVLCQQRTLYGSRHPAVARTLTDMANLKVSLDDVTGAKEMLESALKVYEHLPRQLRDNNSLDEGLTLSSLALVCSSLGERERCRSLLERALVLYQTIPPNGKITMRQRKLVASTLTDITHAYLLLGDTAFAKKYGELALLANRNLYPSAHPETMRSLEVMSILFALVGDKAESQRLRQEAGKLKNQINSQPLPL